MIHILYPRAKLIRRKPLKHDTIAIRPTPCRNRPSFESSKAVTVCIAAIAAKGRAIVMLADRSVSMVRNGQTIFKQDSAVTKIRLLQERWVALISGRIDFGRTVLSWAEDHSVKATHKHIVERSKLAYQAARKVEISDHILTPSLLDEDWYAKKVSSHVSDDDQCFAAIFNAINKYSSETSILLCGFNDQEPNIYIISDPGEQNSATPEGFGIVGIGEDAARSRLFKLKTNPSDDVGKVLYDAYDAKESCAELLPDVGSSWDAMVLAYGKYPAEVPTDVKDLIEQLYKRHPRSPYSKSVRQPINWGERLDEWSESVIN